MLSRRTLLRVAAAGAASSVCAPALLRAQTVKKMSMGSPMADSHAASTFMAAAVEAIKKETNGEVQINFFPNSLLGSEASMQSQLRTGAIDFVVHSCSFLQTVVPTAGLPCVPFAFDNYKTLWGALNGDLGQYTKAALAKSGMTGLKVIDSGFRNTTTSVRPINTVGDFQGLKLRVPPSPMLTSLFTAFGAAPATITVGELYPALQTKLVDGMEASLSLLQAWRAYEVQKYCSMTSHAWDGLWIVARSRGWQELPADMRGVIERTLEAHALQAQAAAEKTDAEFEPLLKQQGLIFNVPDRAPFKDKLKSIGYYKGWQEKFGAEAWSALEKFSGPLNS